MASNAINTDSILNQIRQLDYRDRLNILEKLAALIKKDAPAKEQIKLSSISGLGSEIWKDIDVDKYLENEREWD